MTNESNCSPTDCPLCGQVNRCEVVAGGNGAGCWCQTNDILAAALAAIPVAARGRACICQRCALQYGSGGNHFYEVAATSEKEG